MFKTTEKNKPYSNNYINKLLGCIFFNNKLTLFDMSYYIRNECISNINRIVY